MVKRIKFFALFTALVLIGSCSTEEPTGTGGFIINNQPGSGNDSPDGDADPGGNQGGNQSGTTGSALAAWTEGYLDIHTINTGRGDCTFFILPDGTQMLVDMASATASSHTFVPPKPDGLYSAAFYIRRYIQKCMNWTGNDKLDYVLLTHWHTDHIGTYAKSNPTGTGGDYTRGGVTDILDNLSVSKIIDRGYTFPKIMNWESNGAVANYIKCFKYHVENSSLVREEFEPGVNDQITLQRDAASYPEFSIRNISSNGNVWTGSGTATKYMFIDESEFAANTTGGATEKSPSENGLSITFKLTYGDFDYYTGGDASNNGSGSFSWKVTETDIARAVGQVEAMKANHHGSYDANGETLLTTLDPQVLIFQTWNTAQPHVNTINRLPEIPYTNIFITNMDAGQKANFPTSISNRFNAEAGHYVIRVAPDGKQYYLYVLDDEDPSIGMEVKAVFGPYSCR